MNISHLEYYVTAARKGSFARAAEALFVTPQTISTAVASLEKEWGFPLFRRKRSSIELTEEGAAMLAAAEKVLEDLDGLKDTARKLQDGMKENITFVYASASLPRSQGRLSFESLERFDRENPSVTLSIFELTGDSCIQALQQHRADLAYAPSFSLPGDIDGVVVDRGSFLVGVSKANPLSSKSELSFADLKDQAIFPPPDLGPSYRAIAEHCRACGFEPRFATVPFSAENSYTFIGENQGVSIMPRYLAEDDGRSEELNVVYLPLSPKEDFKLPLYLMWRKGDSKGQSLRSYLLSLYGIEA